MIDLNKQKEHFKNHKAKFIDLYMLAFKLAINKLQEEKEVSRK